MEAFRHRLRARSTDRRDREGWIWASIEMDEDGTHAKVAEDLRHSDLPYTASVRGDRWPPLVSGDNCHAAEEFGKARQGTESGIATSSPAGVEMRDIVSAAWCEAPCRVCTS